MDYRHVEQLFDMIAEYYHNKPPLEEEGVGEWVRVRDGLQGAEHCIRVLTPDEFDEWHRCVEVPVQVEFGRQPVAFCNYEGSWWVIYTNTDESEVIAYFERCFEGPFDPERDASVPWGEISRFFGITIYMPRRGAESPHFHALYDGRRAEFAISPFAQLDGVLPPRALTMIEEWAKAHERDLLEAWKDRAAGREPRKIEPLQ